MSEQSLGENIIDCIKALQSKGYMLNECEIAVTAHAGLRELFERQNVTEFMAKRGYRLTMAFTKHCLHPGKWSIRAGAAYQSDLDYFDAAHERAMSAHENAREG